MILPGRSDVRRQTVPWSVRLPRERTLGLSIGGDIISHFMVGPLTFFFSFHTHAPTYYLLSYYLVLPQGLLPTSHHRHWSTNY